MQASWGKALQQNGGGGSDGGGGDSGGGDPSHPGSGQVDPPQTNPKNPNVIVVPVPKPPVEENPGSVPSSPTSYSAAALELEKMLSSAIDKNYLGPASATDETVVLEPFESSAPVDVVMDDRISEHQEIASWMAALLLEEEMAKEHDLEEKPDSDVVAGLGREVERTGEDVTEDGEKLSKDASEKNIEAKALVEVRDASSDQVSSTKSKEELAPNDVAQGKKQDADINYVDDVIEEVLIIGIPDQFF